LGKYKNLFAELNHSRLFARTGFIFNGRGLYLHNQQDSTFTMTELLKTSLGRLRIVGFLEGVSYLLLLGIAMPLKYLAGQPEAVRITGMAHGVLFVLYVLLVVKVAWELGWSWKKTFLALIASLVPLGTFYADKKWFR
jgi:integral membrane protein